MRIAFSVSDDRVVMNDHPRRTLVALKDPGDQRDLVQRAAAVPAQRVRGPPGPGLAVHFAIAGAHSWQVLTDLSIDVGALVAELEAMSGKGVR